LVYCLSVVTARHDYRIYASQHYEYYCKFVESVLRIFIFMFSLMCRVAYVHRFFGVFVLFEFLSLPCANKDMIIMLIARMTTFVADIHE